ncbi:MAG: hypothetical protein P9X24_06720 [Candidatus Hatepunaea meridiana]|nr:hypothetical protein [Candidatus Hatepunaea meridiana]
MLIYSLLIIGFILAGVLLPRIRFIGEIGSERTLFEVSSFWFGFKLDIRAKTYRYRIFFISFSQKDKIEESKDTVTPEAPPHISPDIDKKPIIEKKEGTREKPKKYKRPKIRRKPKVKKPKVKEKKASKFTKELFWQERELIITVVKRLVSGLLRLFKTPRLDRVRIALDVATPDPMMTGLIYGILLQLTALNNPPRRVINIRSDFNAIIPSGDLYIVFSISLAVVLFESFYLIIRLPWWRILKVYLKYR